MAVASGVARGGVAVGAGVGLLEDATGVGVGTVVAVGSGPEVSVAEAHAIARDTVTIIRARGSHFLVDWNLFFHSIIHPSYPNVEMISFIR